MCLLILKSPHVQGRRLIVRDQRSSVCLSLRFNIDLPSNPSTVRLVPLKRLTGIIGHVRLTLGREGSVLIVEKVWSVKLHDTYTSSIEKIFSDFYVLTQTRRPTKRGKLKEF